MDDQQKAVARAALENVRRAEDFLMQAKHLIRDGAWVTSMDTLADAAGQLHLAVLNINIQVNREIWKNAQNEPKETTPPS